MSDATKYEAQTYTPRAEQWCSGSAATLNHAVILAARAAVDSLHPKVPYMMTLCMTISQPDAEVMWCMVDVVKVSSDWDDHTGQRFYDLNMIVTKPGGVRDMLRLEEVQHTAESITTAVMDFL